MAAISFFGSFASGQSAATLDAQLPVIWFTRITAIIVILPITLTMGNPLMPHGSHLSRLALMGLLDATALALVIYAGTQQFSVLAQVFLQEQMTSKQWIGALLVSAFVCILSI